MGSYGEVWLARDAMQKWRAVKIIARGKSPAETDRGYEREFKALKHYEEISHKDSSLMRIVAVGRDAEDRYFYYSMELADDARTGSPFQPRNDDEFPGLSAAEYRPRTLRSVLRARDRLEPRACVEYAAALAAGLEQVHAAGLLHRDIKPDNIIFVHGRPKLADIGLMTLSDSTYSFAGTMAYLAPEGPRSKASCQRRNESGVIPPV